MPFDPLSAAVAGAGLFLDFAKSQGAQQKANENQKFQVNNLIQAMSEARQGKSAAGGLRLDQFGNATYYDPNQGRWITSFSPTQQRLIDEGQARQGRAQIRGRQASEDYDRLRSEYLYRRPKTEAESYQEIVDLINQAQGSGERQLNTLMNRFGIRTSGNLPRLVQADTGPSPGQQMAETMLKARGAALDESLKRESGHTSRLLPALKQFEDTANYVGPVDPTGSGIIGLESEGRKSMSEYDKLLATLAVSGGRNVGSAYDSATKAAGGGPGAGDFLNIAKMLMPTPEKSTGTLGNTKGARYSADSDGNYSGSGKILQGDHPYSKLIGGEAAPLGGAGEYAYEQARQGDPWYNPTNELTLSPRTGGSVGGNIPYYGNYISGSGPTAPWGDYATPWRF